MLPILYPDLFHWSTSEDEVTAVEKAQGMYQILRWIVVIGASLQLVRSQELSPCNNKIEGEGKGSKYIEIVHVHMYACIVEVFAEVWFNSIQPKD